MTIMIMIMIMIHDHDHDHDLGHSDDVFSFICLPICVVANRNAFTGGGILVDHTDQFFEMAYGFTA